MRLVRDSWWSEGARRWRWRTPRSAARRRRERRSYQQPAVSPLHCRAGFCPSAASTQPARRLLAGCLAFLGSPVTCLPSSSCAFQTIVDTYPGLRKQYPAHPSACTLPGLATPRPNLTRAVARPPDHLDSPHEREVPIVILVLMQLLALLLESRQGRSRGALGLGRWTLRHGG